MWLLPLFQKSLLNDTVDTIKPKDTVDAIIRKDMEKGFSLLDKARKSNTAIGSASKRRRGLVEFGSDTSAYSGGRGGDTYSRGW